MQLFKRHIISTAFLFLYFSWWLLILCSNYFNDRPNRNICGLPILGVVFITLFIVVVYLAVLSLKISSSKEPKQTDYMIFLGFVLFPAILGIIYILSGL